MRTLSWIGLALLLGACGTSPPTLSSSPAESPRSTAVAADFRLTVPDAPVTLAPGSSVAVPLAFAYQGDFKREIRVTVRASAPGVTADPVTVTNRATGAVLRVRADAAAPPGDLTLAVTATAPNLTRAATLRVRVTAAAPDAAAHPRLLVRAADLPRLRARATDANPLYRDGLRPLARRLVQAMDARVPWQQEDGGDSGNDYPQAFEKYALVFAFMSLVENDATVRADYAARARTMLMHVIDAAAACASPSGPYCGPRFALFNRAGWHGDGFPLAVDWIYGSLSAADKAKVRAVFLRWERELQAGQVTTGDTVAAARLQPRWATNNYYQSHLRQTGLLAMALDPQDDPDGALAAYLDVAVNAWLPPLATALRTDAAGGLSPEGTNYGPLGLSYTLEFLYALHTAGQADPARFGNRAALLDDPFWKNLPDAALHTASPRAVTHPGALWNPLREPAAFGDTSNFAVPDLISVLGPLGLYAADRGDDATLRRLRWMQGPFAPGGSAALSDRVARAFEAALPSTAILYFLLMDPAAPPRDADDPRTAAFPTLFVAPGLNRVLARTDWTADASWFTSTYTWNTVDHQLMDAGKAELYRRGEWLTAEYTAYGAEGGTSDLRNTLAIQNDAAAAVANEPYRTMYARGSQYAYIGAGDPKDVRRSAGDAYVYQGGDLTGLYNVAGDAYHRGASDVTLATRDTLWVKPDVVVLYDRAETRTPNRFKRVWLMAPSLPDVAGRTATARTPGGQRLVVTSVLPAAATVAAAGLPAGTRGGAEFGPMRARVMIEATGGPTAARFLTVVQGADATGTPLAVAAVATGGARAVDGAAFGDTAALFVRNANAAPAAFSATLPTGVRRVALVGLRPGETFTATRGGATLSVTPGGPLRADGAGVAWLDLGR